MFISITFEEIFRNKCYNGKKFNDNIKLIGVCKLYRRRQRNKEKCGLSKSEDNEKEFLLITIILYF